MSHHGSEPLQAAHDKLRQQMEIEAQRMQLGATQRTPAGQMHETDEGEIRMGVANDPSRLKVYLNFGKPIAWIGMSPDEARELGETLIEHSRTVRGITA